MARKFSKRLVIDASVAQAAGNRNHSTSQFCTHFLREVYDICHRIVWCPEIEDEWARHETRFTKRWLTEMKSRGKLVAVDCPPDKVVENEIYEII